MKGLVATCLLFAVALSACAGNHRTQPMSTGAQVSARTISSSRLVLGGRVRCTATVSTPVEAGHEIDLRFALHNVSGSSVRAPVVDGSVWLVVESPDGTTYNTRTAESAEGSLGGPYRPPVEIPSGATASMVSPRVSVRWQGPLRIMPGCEKKTLPPLHVKVAAPGPPPDDQTAIAEVVAATGHLLDHCRPGEPGVAVEGRIDAPDGSGDSMDARCSVTLHSEGRFLVAQVLVLIPPNMQGVRVREPYETLSFPKQPPPYEALAWELVVTRDGAVTVAGFNRDATRAADRMAPEWTWSGSGWGRPGSARCGYEGISGGPALDLISACP